MHFTPAYPRKIIHIDMDCFYAAIEIRDDPSLVNKPVAVGGSPQTRGVLCTCNYVARQYGIHSAMSTAKAYQLCKDLVVLPVNMHKYRQVSQHIQDIFHAYTDLVEPLALDEAYLDVTGSTHCQGSATLIAKAICEEIWLKENLTASAGVAPNKFLAKVASGWKKPNGLFVITPTKIDDFVKTLPIEKLFGVGKVNANKLHQLGFFTCSDLQRASLNDLIHHFGKLGNNLYEQCRGIDERPVIANRVRKSLSVERTFPHDLAHIENCHEIVEQLYMTLNHRITDMDPQRKIKNQFVKIKFNDFKLVTAEIISEQIKLEQFWYLLQKSYHRESKPIRLLGIGVHFSDSDHPGFVQQSFI